MSTDRRRIEIEQKRSKLAELKKAREARSAVSSAIPSRTSSSLGEERTSTSRAQLDDLVSNLLLGNVLANSEGEGSASRDVGSGTTSVASERAPDLIIDDPSQPNPVIEESTMVLDSEPAPIPAPPPIIQTPLPPPKVYYDKSIQTNFEPVSVKNNSGLNSSPDTNGTGGGAISESAESMKARITAEFEEERRIIDLEIEKEQISAKLEREQMRLEGFDELTLNKLFISEPFLGWLSTSTRQIERALADSYDHLKDYTITSSDGGVETDQSKVRLVGTWYAEKWGRGRSVTGVDWSPKFPELFAVSYSKNEIAENEPGGIVAIWSLHLLDRPEFIFHSQSDVLSVTFSPFHPNFVIGGTYSGQILVWDTRSKHPNPVLKTPLSAVGHTHPVYSLSIVGTQNSYNLISASTDGTVCAWTLDMLAEPQQTMQLVKSLGSKIDEVSITALSFAEGETTTFWIGTEEGNIYSGNRIARASVKEGLVNDVVYKGHSGPINGMNFHPVAGTLDLSDLFLTCGVDWTIKLWRNRAAGGSNPNASSAGTIANGIGGIYSPLFSFQESNDYVYDVKWHPTHPALFASVDGAGKFDLWNLNLDTEVPIISTTVGSTPTGSTKSELKGLNKLAWDKKEGRRVAIGSADGRVYIYEISEELIKVKETDWEQLRRTCNAAEEGR